MAELETPFSGDQTTKRKRLFGIFGAALLLAGVAVAIWWALTQQGRVSTDNAYVGAEPALVTALGTGVIADVRVGNTGTVKKDDVLVILDDRDARIDLTIAKAALRQAQQRNDDEPARAGSAADVDMARARLDAAELALSRTTIRAPIDGIVINKAVQIGQRVNPGAALMTIVPVDSVYVDANFKESQLRYLKVGQPVQLTSDFYGSAVVFRGRITGFAGGTGAAFALIPAQNATGNWIKIVQRLPVRIALEPAELKAHPLRAGLSMRTTVDTRGN